MIVCDCRRCLIPNPEWLEYNLLLKGKQSLASQMVKGCLLYTSKGKRTDRCIGLLYRPAQLFPEADKTQDADKVVCAKSSGRVSDAGHWP